MQRRNKVLDLMETRSTLTGNKHTIAEYEAAKNEPVELVPAGLRRVEGPAFRVAGPPRPRQMLCPDYPTDCPKVDTGGYKVITTLDWNDAEDRREVGLRRRSRAERQEPLGHPRQPQDPARGALLDPGSARPQHQQRGGRGRGLPDRRDPGLCRVGQLHVEGQQEVPAAVRRAVRRLAPAGVGDQAGRLPDRHRRQDADRLDDAHGRHHQLRRRLHPDPGRPPRARPGPAPLGAPVLAQHPGHQGHDHERPRPRLRADQGLRADLPEDRAAGPVDGHRHARGPPDRPARAPTARSPTTASSCRTATSARSSTVDGERRLARAPRSSPRASACLSAGAAYIVTDILAGNTDKKVNPFWGKWAIYNGKTRRPAAYKTGTTSDNRDVAAYGYLAPPADKKAPALAVGVWMGNSDNSPNDGKLSLDTSAPLWSAILTEVSKGMKIAAVQAAAAASRPPPSTPSPGSSPARSRPRRSRSCSCPGTVPTQKETIRVAASIDEASGLLWRDGCAGPEGHQGLLQPRPRSRRTSRPGRRPNANWGARAAKGSGVARRPEGHPDGLLLQRRVRAVRPELGRAVQADRRKCPLYTPPVSTATRSPPDAGPVRRRTALRRRSRPPPPVRRADEQAVRRARKPRADRRAPR